MPWTSSITTLTQRYEERRTKFCPTTGERASGTSCKLVPALETPGARWRHVFDGIVREANGLAHVPVGKTQVRVRYRNKELTKRSGYMYFSVQTDISKNGVSASGTTDNAAMLEVKAIASVLAYS